MDENEDYFVARDQIRDLMFVLDVCSLCYQVERRISRELEVSTPNSRHHRTFYEPHPKNNNFLKRSRKKKKQKRKQTSHEADSFKELKPIRTYSGGINMAGQGGIRTPGVAQDLPTRLNRQRRSVKTHWNSAKPLG